MLARKHTENGTAEIYPMLRTQDEGINKTSDRKKRHLVLHNITTLLEKVHGSELFSPAHATQQDGGVPSWAPPRERARVPARSLGSSHGTGNAETHRAGRTWLSRMARTMRRLSCCSVTKAADAGVPSQMWGAL